MVRLISLWRTLTSLISVRGGVVHGVEGEAGVSGEGEGVDGERVQLLARLAVSGAGAASGRCQLGNAVADEEDKVDQCPVGGTCLLASSTQMSSCDAR